MVRIGDIDGKGKIYDVRGELILKKGETIIRIFENEDIYAQRGYGIVGSRIVFLREGGKGRLYVTNLRVIFLRRPNPDAYSDFSVLSAPSTAANILRAKDLSRRGAMEFLEFNLNEVVRHTLKRKKYATYYLKTQKGNEYVVHLDRTSKSDNKLEVIRNLIKNRTG
jgi:hypothetical protein